MQSRIGAKMEKKAAGRFKVILASVLGCIVTLQLGAFSVVLETSLSGITELPFGAFCGLMQPIHLAIGLVEGLITAAVLVFVFESRPELLQEADFRADGVTGKGSLRSTVVTLAVVTAFVGGALSLFGNQESGYSANMGLDEENFGVESSAADTAASIQEKTAVLPDYAFSNSDSAAGTTVSGIVGSAVVAAVAAAICLIGRFFRKKTVHG